MAGTRPVRTWKKGDGFSAEHLNEGLGIIRSRNPTVSRGNVRHLPNGTSIDIPEQFVPGAASIGVIHDVGPAGEADFANEQYWVWVQYVIADKWGVVVDVEKTYPGTGTNTSDVIVPATNLSERKQGGPSGSGSHTLLKGTPVLIMPVYGRTTSAADVTVTQRFVFFAVPSVMTPVRITGTESGGGSYAGRVLTGKITFTAAGTAYSMPDGLTDPGVDNAFILYPPDMDGSSGATGSHSLPRSGAGSYGVGMKVGVTNETTPRSILFWVSGWSPPTPRPQYSVLMPINATGDLAFSRPRLV